MPKRISSPKLKDILQTGDFDRADAIALQAVSAGVADAAQQKRAIEWIIYNACDFHGISYRESDRATAFMEGRRFVAQQINALLTHNTRIMNSD